MQERQKLQELLKTNIIPIVVITLINFYVLGRFIVKDALLHGLGYFLFFYAAIFLIYWFPIRQVSENLNPVKKPKEELIVATLLALIGLIAIFANFYLRSTGQTYSPLIRLPIIVLMLLCTFPIAMAVYLLFKRYRIHELGFRLKPWIILLLGFLVWGVTGLFAMIFHYEGLLWKLAYEELGGIPGLIIQGIIGAALAEEFFRFVFQTRFKSVFRNSITAIIISSVIWSAFHFPSTFYKTESLISTLNYCIQIVPLGIVWGYLTHKTKSFVPAVIAHGLNLWGFQNG